MALTKSIDTQVGVEATYWRIVRVDVDLKIRKVWFMLDGYVSQLARTEGKEPLRQLPLTVDLEEGVEPEDLGRTQLYAYAKTQELFDGAEDA